MMLLRELLAALKRCYVSSPRRIAAVAAAFFLGAILVRPISAELIYGIANQAPATALLTWDSATPGALQTGVFLSGLQANETILGIDFRPATGQLYGLGSTSRLYTINPTSGAATAVGGPFLPGLSGFSFGFDFNPVADCIRVVAETNQNLVLDPNSGAVQTVSPNVFYAAGDPNAGQDPNIVDAAYTNNFPGAGATLLYGIDTGLDVLAQQNPTTGALTTIGSLGLNVVAAGGFDVSGTTGVAYAVMLPVGSSQSSLFTINLATGLALPVGVIDGGLVVTAMTVAPVPEPASAGLLLLGVAAIVS